MIPSEQARGKLDELIRSSEVDDYTSISILIGKNHAYIQQYIRRGVPSSLKEQDRKKIAKHFGICHWEIGGPFPDYDEKPLRGFSEAANDGVIFVPSYDIKASAGSGSYVDADWPEHFLPFRASWLRQIDCQDTTKLTVISVTGDSMYPTLSDGDDILVDTSETAPTHDGIYVLRRDETLHVKRLSFNPANKTLTIRSDNPLYQSWSDCKPGDINVVGRVVWFARAL
jgi:Peptidase S24-like